MIYNFFLLFLKASKAKQTFVSIPKNAVYTKIYLHIYYLTLSWKNQRKIKITTKIKTFKRTKIDE